MTICYVLFGYNPAFQLWKNMDVAKYTWLKQKHLSVFNSSGDCVEY